MSRKKGNLYGAVIVYEKKHKGTSIGRHPITSTMNKSTRRSYKKNRGQGRAWQISPDILYIQNERKNKQKEGNNEKTNEETN